MALSGNGSTHRRKNLKEDIVEKDEIAQNEQFCLCPQIVFYHAICILNSFNSNILVVFCSFFDFGMVSKWCIREWVIKEI